VRGLRRAHVDALHAGGHLSTDITPLADAQAWEDDKCEALKKLVITRFEQHAARIGWPSPDASGPSGPPKLAAIVAGLRQLDAGGLADTIAAHTPLPLAQKQVVLEMLDARSRLEYVWLALEELLGGSGH